MAEAQSTDDLPIIICDKVPGIKVDGLVQILNLEKEDSVWADTIIKLAKANIKARKSQKEGIREINYDIEIEAKKTATIL